MNARVTICGAFGGVNIGDEAIAQTMRHCIAAAFPKAKIGVICTVTRAVLAQNSYALEGAEVASRQDWRYVTAWLRQGPLVIGGGQMLNGSRTSKGLGYLLLIAWIARLFGQKVFILGVGTRAVEKFGLSAWIMRRLAATSSVLRVRDVQSHAALVACGVAQDRVEITADVVFTGVIAPPRSDDGTARAGLLLAVHQSPLVKHYRAQDFAQFAQCVARARGESEIRLLCHDVRPGFDLDFATQVADILRRFPDLSVTILAPKSVGEAMALYGQTDLIISSRMHPLIMGLVAGANVLALGGAGKVANLTQRFGAFAPLNIAATSAEIAAALRDVQQGGQILAGVPQDLKDLAHSNFNDLAKLAT